MPAITSNLNLTQIAIKRLSGKAMTNSNFTIAQEDLGSTVQTAAGTIFGEAIPPSPDSGSGKLNIIQSSSVGSPGTVQLVMLTASAYGTEYQNITNFTKLDICLIFPDNNKPECVPVKIFNFNTINILTI